MDLFKFFGSSSNTGKFSKNQQILKYKKNKQFQTIKGLSNLFIDVNMNENLLKNQISPNAE